jgi:hypothetical protein
VPIAPATIATGTIWEDANNNATLDGGETRFENVTVTLKSGDCNGAAVDTATTNSTGGFTFSSLSAGSYCVVVEVGTMPSPVYGWVCTTQTTNQVAFTIASGATRYLPFGFMDTMQ